MSQGSQPDLLVPPGNDPAPRLQPLTRVFDQLGQARVAAGMAGDDAAAPDLFQTWAWFDNLDRFGRPEQELPLCLLLGEPERGASAALPLVRRPRSPAALYGPSVAAMTTYYSSLYGPAGAANLVGVQDLRAALAVLRRHGSAADVLEFQPLERDGLFHRAMAQALREEGYIVDSYFCFGNWHLPCKGMRFDAYHATLPSKVRNTIQRNRKKLDKHGAWSIEIHSEAGPGMEQAIEAFVSVYNRSWKVPEPFPDFVPGLCRTAAREGWLRLGVLRVDGAPAAAQLWLVRQRRAMIYKLAYDEAYAQFSPGSVLSCEMFRRMLDEEQVVDIDYLTGDDRYKQDWMTQRRERCGLVAFRRASLRGLLSAARHGLGRWLRERRAVSRAPSGDDITTNGGSAG